MLIGCQCVKAAGQAQGRSKGAGAASWFVLLLRCRAELGENTNESNLHPPEMVLVLLQYVCTQNNVEARTTNINKLDYYSSSFTVQQFNFTAFLLLQNGKTHIETFIAGGLSDTPLQSCHSYYCGWLPLPKKTPPCRPLFPSGALWSRRTRVHLHIVVDGPPFFHGADDRREIIIRQDHVRGILP